MFDVSCLDFRQININHSCQLKKCPRQENLGAAENGPEEKKADDMEFTKEYRMDN